MKSIFAIAVLFLAHVSFAEEGLVEKTNLSPVESKIIELFTPHAEKIGLKRIAFFQDYEHPEYTGGVNIEDGVIRIMFGSEFENVYPDFPEDAYAEVVCHEIGHILGQTAYEEQEQGQRYSPEAASDYFAGAVCLPKLFKVLPAKKTVFADPVIIESCKKQYDLEADQKICERVAMAGFSFFTEFRKGLIKMVPSIKNEKFYALPDFSKKDEGFYDFYPSLQCRAETIAQAALCATSETLWSQGKKDWHCKGDAGARHKCWYKY